MTADLCAALEAALPEMTDDQARRARDLLGALIPPMKEPTWPGAPVIAAAPGDDWRYRLHVRRNDGPDSGWECSYSCACAEWRDLVNPRPLAPAEYAKYGIPSECERPHAEPITDELIERCIEATDDSMDPTWSMKPSWVRAAGHPEATR